MTEEAVVGVGNPLMSDDSVGRHVVDALRERPAVVASEVSLAFAQTTAFLALEALDGVDRGLVVDAVTDGEAPPGTVHRYRLVDGTFQGQPPDLCMHEFSFADAVDAGRSAYDIPDAVVVLGVEPADTSAGVELSDPVAARLPAVVEAVLAELETVERTGPTDGPTPVGRGTSSTGGSETDR